MRTHELPLVRPEDGHHMPPRTYDDVCLAGVRLRDRERDYFQGCPLPAIPVPQHTRCRLPAGHSGPHLGDAVYSALELAGWLHWGGSRDWRRRAFHAPVCRNPSERYRITFGVPERCRLPIGHRGLHSFDYFPGLATDYPALFWLSEHPWPHED